MDRQLLDRQAGRQADRRTDRQRDRQTNRQKDRQTDMGKGAAWNWTYAGCLVWTVYVA